MKASTTGSVWVQWLVVGYALAIILWQAVRVLAGDNFWPWALINMAAEYMAVPLLPLVVMALFSTRPRLLLGVLVIPTLVFVWLFGELFLPRLQATREGPRLKIMTYNVLFSNEDFDAIGDAIRAVGPDIVGFEELTGAHEALPPLLASEYPYATFSHTVKINDVGLISRYPIESVERIALPPLNLALHAIVNVDGRRLHVIVAHLTPNNYPLSQMPELAAGRFAARAGETERLAGDLLALGGPAVLLCDCNLTDTSEAYRTLNSVLSDSFREAGWGLGHSSQPFGLPVAIMRVDYVWHNRAFFAASAGVGQRGGSDHRPVWAELVWVP